MLLQISYWISSSANWNSPDVVHVQVRLLTMIIIRLPSQAYQVRDKPPMLRPNDDIDRKAFVQSHPPQLLLKYLWLTCTVGADNSHVDSPNVVAMRRSLQLCNRKDTSDARVYAHLLPARRLELSDRQVVFPSIALDPHDCKSMRPVRNRTCRPRSMLLSDLRLSIKRAKICLMISFGGISGTSVSNSCSLEALKKRF